MTATSQAAVIGRHHFVFARFNPARKARARTNWLAMSSSAEDMMITVREKSRIRARHAFSPHFALRTIPYEWVPQCHPRRFPDVCRDICRGKTGTCPCATIHGPRRDFVARHGQIDPAIESPGVRYDARKFSIVRRLPDDKTVSLGWRAVGVTSIQTAMPIPGERVRHRPWVHFPECSLLRARSLNRGAFSPSSRRTRVR